MATGKDDNLKHFHNVVKHPGDRANEFRIYLSTSTLGVVLKPDSCRYLPGQVCSHDLLTAKLHKISLTASYLQVPDISVTYPNCITDFNLHTLMYEYEGGLLWVMEHE